MSGKREFDVRVHLTREECESIREFMHDVSIDDLLVMDADERARVVDSMPDNARNLLAKLSTAFRDAYERDVFKQMRAQLDDESRKLLAEFGGGMR